VLDADLHRTQPLASGTSDNPTSGETLRTENGSSPSRPVLTNGLDLDSSGRWTDRHLTMPEALVRSLEEEVGMFLILVQIFRFLSSAMRLTTFMTTIRVCPLKSPKVRNPICKGNRTSADSLGHAADVWGSRAMSSCLVRCHRDDLASLMILCCP
jgi:hypothetical protein